MADKRIRRSMRKPSYCSRLGLLLSLLLVMASMGPRLAGARAAPLAQGTTFTVNSTADPGDGACDATCTLRDAIAAANGHPGLDTIAFDIPSPGPHTIQPTSALPTIADPVIIDGYTQPGAQPNTHPAPQGLDGVLLIELDGSQAGAADGLRIGRDGSTVRGLVMNRFSQSGIAFVTVDDAPASQNAIEGSYLGTDVTGTTGLGNGYHGVDVDAGYQNLVGGKTPAARNLISGNGLTGVMVHNVANGTQVQGNLIGTDATGTAPLGNSEGGVRISQAINTIIGGTASGTANVISGNASYGVRIGGSISIWNVVQGNLIGTGATGSLPLGNGDDGVLIVGSVYNAIGGTAARAPNTIAYNGGAGVAIQRWGAVPISRNGIFENGELGIDLDDDGVTPNDPQDGDWGSNDLQNFPVLAQATTGAGDIRIEGMLNSTPDTAFTLEFFANRACDASGYGEGEVFLCPAAVTTDASGDATVAVTCPGTVPAGYAVTATATDPNGNTSEFSPCVAAVAPGVVNDGLALGSIETMCQPAGPGGAVGVSTISAAFTNVSSEDLSCLSFRVIQLTGGHLVLNADGGPAGAGAVVSVPPEALGPDGQLAPGESFQIDFEIGLTTLRSFVLFVDAYGVPGAGTARPGHANHPFQFVLRSQHELSCMSR